MSEKLVIEKSTLVGIADAIRTKDGSSDIIPVPNLRQKILDIPSGGGTSHLLRVDDYTCQVTCDCGQNVVNINPNIDCNAVDPSIPLAPEGARHLIIVPNYDNYTVGVQRVMYGVGATRHLFETFYELWNMSSGSATDKARAKCLGMQMTHDAYGFTTSNNTTVTGMGTQAYTLTSPQLLYSVKESVFGEYDQNAIASVNHANMCGLFINDAGHIIFVIKMRTTASSQRIELFAQGQSYKLYWYGEGAMFKGLSYLD